jgi:hypothetical protein
LASSLGDVLAKWTQSVVVPNVVHPKIGDTCHLAQLKLGGIKFPFLSWFRRIVATWAKLLYSFDVKIILLDGANTDSTKGSDDLFIITNPMIAGEYLGTE